MRPVRLPLRNGKPYGTLSTADQSWTIHAVRSYWCHGAPATALPGEETARWQLLIEGPVLHGPSEEGFFEVFIRRFATDGSWWMDTV